jgi:hypothetical protein
MMDKPRTFLEIFIIAAYYRVTVISISGGLFKCRFTVQTSAAFTTAFLYFSGNSGGT